MKIFLITLGFVLAASCTLKPTENPKTDVPAVKPDVPVVTPSEGPVVKLSWEKYPENEPWSKYTYNLICGELFPIFDKASDRTKFHAKYDKMPKEQKCTVWAELISQMSLYESSWNPVSRMTETTMGTDPITGKQVSSEGLLQLSYQDVQWAKFCKFDWAKDKNLAPKDPKKTILDPYLNLDCGIRILAQQIEKKGSVLLSSGVYWAVLKIGGKYSKIDKITAATKALPFQN